MSESCDEGPLFVMRSLTLDDEPLLEEVEEEEMEEAAEEATEDSNHSDSLTADGERGRESV